jgi:hypothetical protein
LATQLGVNPAHRNAPLVSARQQSKRVGEERPKDETIPGSRDRWTVRLDHGDIDHSAAQQRERVLALGGTQRELNPRELCSEPCQGRRQELGAGGGERRHTQRPS